MTADARAERPDGNRDLAPAPLAAGPARGSVVPNPGEAADRPADGARLRGAPAGRALTALPTRVPAATELRAVARETVQPASVSGRRALEGLSARAPRRHEARAGSAARPLPDARMSVLPAPADRMRARPVSPGLTTTRVGPAVRAIDRRAPLARVTAPTVAAPTTRVGPAL